MKFNFCDCKSMLMSPILLIPDLAGLISNIPAVWLHSNLYEIFPVTVFNCLRNPRHKKLKHRNNHCLHSL